MKLTDDAKQRALALADALDLLANDAAVLHCDVRSRGLWGTGVTEGVETKLTEVSESLRSLLAAASREERS